MSIQENSAVLQNEDFVAVFDTVRHIHEAPTLDDLKNTLQSRLIPILDSNSHFVSWSHPPTSKWINSNALNTFEIGCDDLKKLISFCPASEKVCAESCPLKVHPGSVAKTLRENLRKLPKHHPCCECISSGLNEMGQRNTASGVGFMRLLPRDNYWTLRDKMILDLVWPNILQSTRTIFHKKFTIKLQAIPNILKEISVPMAIVNTEFFVQFHNEAFDEVFPFKSGEQLPKAITNVLSRRIKQSAAPSSSPATPLEISFFTSNHGLFRMSFSQLDDKEDTATGYWVIKMVPLQEFQMEGRRNIAMHSLTNREREICALIIDGRSPKEIARQLFISYNTTRNHLSNIYKKLGVCSREKLTAILSK
jgi:DNA-binding CsgD family transcriptional regulator